MNLDLTIPLLNAISRTLRDAGREHPFASEEADAFIDASDSIENLLDIIEADCE